MLDDVAAAGGEAALVKGYRCYFLDGTGHIARREELIAADDASAVEQVQGLLRTSPYPAAELWDLGRMVDQLTRGEVPGGSAAPCGASG